MIDGPTLRIRIQRARYRADVAQRRIDEARAEIAVGRSWWDRGFARVRLYFARREKLAAVAAAERARLRLMAMVI